MSPSISRFFGIIIVMHFDDHAPPHFHATYNEYEAQILIGGGLVKGYLPPRVLGLVIERGMLHQRELLDNWRVVEEGGEFSTIASLE